MTDWLESAARDTALMDDFRALCAFGGRLTGSGQETTAMAWALDRLRAVKSADAASVRQLKVPYDGWRCLYADLRLVAPAETSLACKPLLRSASTSPEGLEAEVLDLGEGRIEDFERAGDHIRGRIVLVRHEYPFSPTHLHRRRKYDLAAHAGAAGFLIANPLPGGGLLSGSSGRARDAAGVPAAYIDHRSSQALANAARAGTARVRLCIEGEEIPGSMADVGVLEIPGGRKSQIVISAHVDGHDLGQSALDNATGVVVALAAARALAAHVSARTPGLRICLFTAEEWALAGSARYLADMTPAERERIKLDINLDTVAGDESLTALISDFPALEGYVAKAAVAVGTSVSTWLPFMPNSDHANFARHGIPALRLLAGFDKPNSRVNNILSAGDVAGIVEESELRRALAVTCSLAWTALNSSDVELDALARQG